MTATKAVAGQRATAAFWNTNVPGDWQAVTPSGGWTDTGGGNATFQARMFNSVTVEVIGMLTAGTISDGTQIGTLPAGMIPASSQAKPGVVVSPSGVHGASFQLQFTSLGAIKIFDAGGLPATTTGIGFDVFVSLDA